MSKLGLGEPIVLRGRCSLLLTLKLYVEKSSTKERTMEQVVMRGWWFVVEADFEQQPRIGEAFDVW